MHSNSIADLLRLAMNVKIMLSTGNFEESTHIICFKISDCTIFEITTNLLRTALLVLIAENDCSSTVLLTTTVFAYLITKDSIL